MKLFRIRGASMEPTLQDGDILLMRKRPPRPGEIVVVDHPRFGVIVKRLTERGTLTGDGEDSTDETRLGAYANCRPIGTAVMAVTPSGMRRLSARRSVNRA